PSTNVVPIDLTSVTDDGGVPGSVDFLPTSVNTLNPAFNDGDVNHNNLLDPGETWLYVASGDVAAGDYENTATANGVFRVGGVPFQTSATDVANIRGTEPGIKVLKLANGQHAAPPGAAVYLQAGATVTWTFKVTDTTASASLSNVTLTDLTLPGVVVTFAGGDGNANGLLDPGETWLYTASSAAPAGLFGNVALASGTQVGCTGSCPVYADHLPSLSPLVPNIPT